MSIVFKLVEQPCEFQRKSYLPEKRNLLPSELVIRPFVRQANSNCQETTTTAVVPPGFLKSYQASAFARVDLFKIEEDLPSATLCTERLVGNLKVAFDDNDCAVFSKLCISHKQLNGEGETGEDTRHTKYFFRFTIEIFMASKCVVSTEFSKPFRVISGNRNRSVKVLDMAYTENKEKATIDVFFVGQNFGSRLDQVDIFFNQRRATIKSICDTSIECEIPNGTKGQKEIVTIRKRYCTPETLVITNNFEWN